MKYISRIGIYASVMLPLVSFAQTGSQTINGWIRLVDFVIAQLFPILIALAGVVFMYQIIRFLFSQKAEEREQYRKSITVNLVILVIMVTLFGLIKILASTFGLTIGTDLGLSSGVGGTGVKGSFRAFVYGITGFISKTMIPTAMAVATLTFLWNLVIYLYQTDNEAERTKARDYIAWSLLAIAILLTSISIVGTGTKTFFGTSAFIPQFPTSSGQ